MIALEGNMAKTLNDAGLADPEDKMLLLIIGFAQTRKRAPSLRELADLYGCSHVYVLKMLVSLEVKGRIEREDGSIVVVDGKRVLPQK